MACSSQTPDPFQAITRAPTREVTATLRHPEAAVSDHRPPPCPAPWILTHTRLEGISFYGPRLSGRPNSHQVFSSSFFFVQLFYFRKCVSLAGEKSVFFLKKSLFYSCFLGLKTV